MIGRITAQSDDNLICPTKNELPGESGRNIAQGNVVPCYDVSTKCSGR